MKFSVVKHRALYVACGVSILVNIHLADSFLRWVNYVEYGWNEIKRRSNDVDVEKTQKSMVLVGIEDDYNLIVATNDFSFSLCSRMKSEKFSASCYSSNFLKNAKANEHYRFFVQDDSYEIFWSCDAKGGCCDITVKDSSGRVWQNINGDLNWLIPDGVSIRTNGVDESDNLL